jgi:hypothetical protein
MRIIRVLRFLTLAAATAATLITPANASTSHRFGSLPSAQTYPTVRKFLQFQNMRVRIASAEDKTRALLRAHPGMVLPAHPLFVADPALNAIVVFDMNGTGTQVPSAVLSGPNTQLNGPDSITEGWDEPCMNGYTHADCTDYIYVVNAGNDTVNAYTYPFTSANQGPKFTFSTPSSCPLPGLGFPAGISHLAPTSLQHPGYLVISDEHAATNGAIEVYNVPLAPSGTNCSIAADTNPPDTRIASASGLSGYGTSRRAEIFNANATTVTLELYRSIPRVFTPQQAWAVGGTLTPASTQGTAFDPTQNGGSLWVSTAHGMTTWPDAIWLCTRSAFVTNSCPNTAPTITAGLSFPVFLKASQTNNRLYVPNLNNATVTSYREANPTAVFATYVNLAAPWDVAGAGM